LLALDGKLQGVRLKIGTPHVSEQEELPLLPAPKKPYCKRASA